ncbi:MAG: hypothetical protein ABIO34_00665 [Arthrobacter oryzae]
MKKFRALLMAVLLAAGAGLLAPGPASAAAPEPYCGLVWGSLMKTDDSTGTVATYPRVINVRTGQHYCFDRMVIDHSGSVAGYTVRYVDKVVQDGSGFTVPLRGQAFLQVTVNAPAYDDAGQSTYNPADKKELTNVTGYQTFRQLVDAGSYEGYTTVGLGVRGRLPFRVFTLEGPGAGSRLVIDVAHFW